VPARLGGAVHPDENGRVEVEQVEVCSVVVDDRQARAATRAASAAVDGESAISPP
jgi:hypothetical protein